MEYRTERLDLVNNPTYRYYKLYVDDKCQFDDFYNEIVKDVRKAKDLSGIINLMDNLGAILLPAAKFNHIKDSQRSDLYEFKKNSLRVYVINQKPEIYVVMGGEKKEQKQDIANFKRKIKDFPKMQ